MDDLEQRDVRETRYVRRIPDDENWHLDKKVPLGIIGAILLQTVIFVWVGASWKAQIDSRVDHLEKNDTARAGQADRLTVLEQQLGFISKTVIRIESKLDGVPPVGQEK